MAGENASILVGINPLQNTVQLLKDFGFFQVILPLILVFAVLYGILSITEIFGKDDKAVSINAVIAFSASFFIISSTEVVAMMNEFLPHASFLLVMAVFLLMLFGMFLGSPQNLFGDKVKKWTVIPLILIFVIFLGVIDASIEDVQIPIIHQLNNAFIGSSISSDSSGGGSGGGFGSGGEDLPWYENPATIELINILISLSLVLGFPVIVIWLMVRKSSSKP